MFSLSANAILRREAKRWRRHLGGLRSLRLEQALRRPRTLLTES